MFCSQNAAPSQLHTDFTDVSYPPGVVQETIFSSDGLMSSVDKSAGLVISLIPEQWSSPADAEIIAELAAASMDHLFYAEDRDPFKDELFAMSYLPSSLDMRPLADQDIEEALLEFEEDFEYEESLKVEQIKNAEVNLHRLLACSDLSKRPGWQGDPGDMNTMVYHKERYRFNVEMITAFPHNKKGYALGWTDYGKIYFPERFRGYVPQIGRSADVSVALQDIAPKNGGKPASFRFSAIYMH